MSNEAIDVTTQAKIKTELEKILNDTSSNISVLKRVEKDEFLNKHARHIILSEHPLIKNAKNLVNFDDEFDQKFFDEITKFDEAFESDLNFREEEQEDNLEYGDFKFILYCFLNEEKLISKDIVEDFLYLLKSGELKLFLAVLDFFSWKFESKYDGLSKEKEEVLAVELFYSMEYLFTSFSNENIEGVVSEADAFNLVFFLLRYQKNFFEDFCFYNKFIIEFLEMVGKSPEEIFAKFSEADIISVSDLYSETVEKDYPFLSAQENQLTQKISVLIKILISGDLKEFLKTVKEEPLISLLFILFTEMHSKNSFNFFNLFIFEIDEGSFYEILSVVLKCEFSFAGFVANQFVLNNKNIHFEPSKIDKAEETEAMKCFKQLLNL